MHKLKHIEGATLVSQASAQPPFGPSFSVNRILKATRLEVWGTEWFDGEEDYTEFRLYNADTLLDVRRIMGY